MMLTPSNFARRSPPPKARGYNERRTLKMKLGAAVRTAHRPSVSEQTARTFRKISDPRNARLFTVAAALAAFDLPEGWDK